MKTKKVCIVVTSLGRGGAERSSALLSIMLDNLGYNVHIVSVLNDIEYEYAFAWAHANTNIKKPLKMPGTARGIVLITIVSMGVGSTYR